MKIKNKINQSPYSLPIEMRPLWRICLIISSIAIVSGKKEYLDINKINILVWMLIRHSRWKIYEDYLFDRNKEIPLVSVDTATYRAIEFCIAKGFVSMEDAKLHMTDLGKLLFSILVTQNIMVDERNFLLSIGKNLTEKKVNSLTGKF